jgi:hypothetical protein
MGVQAFLEQNGLKLILRSHEGPDARYKREDMPDVQGGYAIDHVTPAGSLVTVFSAPDYPQFQVGYPLPFSWWAFYLCYDICILACLCRCGTIIITTILI